MKIGVLSDIHGNYYAFKACVDYMVHEGISDFLLLGDYVSDTSFPEKTMELIYELKGMYRVHMLRGNRKKWVPEFLKIPYDIAPVVKDIFASGLYDMAPWFINSNIQILLTGTDHSAEMVARAIDLQTKDTGKEAKWPLIEEKYFRRAAENLGYRIIRICWMMLAGSL